MRVIGLIGGLSWESTVIYYQVINRRVRERLGGSHSADSLIWSVDYTTVEELAFAGRWDEVSALLSDAGRKLQDAGAGVLLVCSNTFSKVSDDVARATSVPVLHIADAVADEVRSRGMRKVGLLGTRFTMEMDFYRARMRGHGIDVLVPDEPDRTLVHDVIYQELTLGRVEPASREAYRRVIAGLAGRGAQGVILGCTEITLLVGQDDSPVPVFDSTRIHVEAALGLALAPDEAARTA